MDIIKYDDYGHDISTFVITLSIFIHSGWWFMIIPVGRYISNWHQQTVEHVQPRQRVFFIISRLVVGVEFENQYIITTQHIVPTFFFTVSYGGFLSHAGTLGIKACLEQTLAFAGFVLCTSHFWLYWRWFTDQGVAHECFDKFMITN